MKYTLKYKEVILETRDAESNFTSPQSFLKLSKNIIEEYPEYDVMQEQMFLFGMNVRNEISLFHTVAKGGKNFIMISPSDIFCHLIRLGLPNFIICHNHPSGHLEPSEEDYNFNKKLNDGAKLLGLNFLDHIIIANNKDDFYSFKQSDISFGR